MNNATATRIAPFYATGHTLNDLYSFRGEVTDVHMVLPTMISVRMTLSGEDADRYALANPRQARRDADGRVVGALLVLKRHEVRALLAESRETVTIFERVDDGEITDAIDVLRERADAVDELLALPITHV